MTGDVNADECKTNATDKSGENHNFIFQFVSIARFSSLHFGRLRFNSTVLASAM